jgi:hypothetical protein
MENPTKIFDINRPWNSLDDWQKEYIFDTPADQDCFLLCGRQVGKTTAMSIKAVELCVNHFKAGDYVLINSITEKQAYHMLTKSLIYAENKYPRMIKQGKDKPTMHKINFRNGTGILCFAAGESGEGLRGFTIKKLMSDEDSRMSEEYHVAVMPMLSVVGGSMDVASTPFGKRDKEGNEKFFYKCSLDPKFKKFYVSAEDCPRHTKEFLEEQRNRMTKLQYAQEYLAVFTDELQRIFSDELINRICHIKKMDVKAFQGTKRYLGVDIAGYGKDDNAYCGLETKNNLIWQFLNMVEKRKLTTETARKIIELEEKYQFKKIGIDDGGLGFGVYSSLLEHDKTKRKTEALNNASRIIKNGLDEKSKKLLKEEMYLNLLNLMENNKIALIDDDEIKASLASIQYDEGKIYGGYSHIAEAIIRSAWLAEKDKTLNIFIHRF